MVACAWFLVRTERRQLDRVTAIDLTMVCLIAGFVGARGLHVLYEDFGYYSGGHWTQILAVWNGGFVFLGGAVTAFLFTAIFCQIKREPFWIWADTASLPIGLGYGLGRLACLANGCCFGRECHLPWSIDLHGASRHPTQLYATLWEILSVGALAGLEKRLKTPGVLFNLWLLLHAAGRAIMEHFRADPRGTLIHGMSLGTWMSAGLALYAALNLGAALRAKAFS